MLSEKQIRAEKSKLLTTKRRAVKMQKICRKGTKSWNKHKENIASLVAQLKIIRAILKGSPIEYKKLKTKKEVMSYVYKMRQIKTIVRETLKYDLESRDDDNLLCFRIWEKQGSTPKMSYQALQAKLITGQFAAPESIGRARRNLQERHPTLRGKLYDKRHQAEETFRTQYQLEF